MPAVRKRSVRLTANEAKKLHKKMEMQVKQKLANIGSIGEETLAAHFKVNNISFIREFKFHPTRRYRADFYIESSKLLIEVEGGTKGKSRHTTHEGYSEDLMKYNWAQILGYSRLAFTTQQVLKGEAIKMIKEFLKLKEGQPVDVSTPSVIVQAEFDARVRNGAAAHG
ncbi:DUF559 domain-containing protein [uncultured Acinetobacter sp.]|uniref:DUF559 domain-containing protein n=1 Tax=uncultured Acinetobacter sp. TaxID=165433 RepID=UPI00258771C0|nr:DUF559 domain-containing protein [uncultured Acinetobacter sp.]